MQLKYLFSGEYTDGTSFAQTAEDVSVIDPTKSAFYDVLSSGKTVKTFTLTGPQTLSVDLTTGVFTLNGVPFLSEGDTPLPLARDLRLIFYRQHRHQFNRATREELAHQVTYYIGWQTTINGKNYQQVIGIS